MAMKWINKKLGMTEEALYGIFGLIVVAITFFTVFWGNFHL